MYISPVNNNTLNCKKPCFQARLAPKLRDSLISTAQKENRLTEFVEQFNKLDLWGGEKSIISTALKPRIGKESLILTNDNLSKVHCANLISGDNLSLLDQFLNLNEGRILKAEKDIQRAVKKN